MKHFIVGSGWKMVKTYRDSIETAKELERRTFPRRSLIVGSAEPEGIMLNFEKTA